MHLSFARRIIFDDGVVDVVNDDVRPETDIGGGNANEEVCVCSADRRFRAIVEIWPSSTGNLVLKTINTVADISCNRKIRS